MSDAVSPSLLTIWFSTFLMIVSASLSLLITKMRVVLISAIAIVGAKGIVLVGPVVFVVRHPFQCIYFLLSYYQSIELVLIALLMKLV